MAANEAGEAGAAALRQVVGVSERVRPIYAQLFRAASSQATILLEGETGTGKSLLAQAIHEASPRRQGPFAVVDCGAIPPPLLESELFGHERGAFTGAVQSRAGAFEAANQGTIFLDEIGELGLELQPKILRVIEERRIKRVGSTQYVPVDVRVVAATNRSLKLEVEAKRFRSDLYYRLAVVRARVPALRERPEDIPLLVQSILQRLDASDTPLAEQISEPEYLRTLERFEWPGNIRQLRNHLERCVALGELLPPADASIEPPRPTPASGHTIDVERPFRIAREEWLATFERTYLEAILERHGGNVSAAARAAGLDRIHFYRLLWKHGLRMQHQQASKVPTGEEE